MRKQIESRFCSMYNNDSYDFMFGNNQIKNFQVNSTHILMRRIVMCCCHIHSMFLTMFSINLYNSRWWMDWMYFSKLFSNHKFPWIATLPADFFSRRLKIRKRLINGLMIVYADLWIKLCWTKWCRYWYENHWILTHIFIIMNYAICITIWLRWNFVGIICVRKCHSRYLSILKDDPSNLLANRFSFEAKNKATKECRHPFGWYLR